MQAHALQRTPSSNSINSRRASTCSTTHQVAVRSTADVQAHALQRTKQSFDQQTKQSFYQQQIQPCVSSCLSCHLSGRGVLVEELYSIWYQSGSFSFINVGSDFHCLHSFFLLFILSGKFSTSNTTCISMLRNTHLGVSVCACLWCISEVLQEGCHVRTCHQRPIHCTVCVCVCVRVLCMSKSVGVCACVRVTSAQSIAQCV